MKQSNYAFNIRPGLLIRFIFKIKVYPIRSKFDLIMYNINK